MRGNAVEVDDPETVEDCLIESSPHLVAGVEVQLARVPQRLDPPANLGDTFGQAVLHCSKLLFDGAPLVFDIADPGAGLRRHRAAFGHQVDEVVGFRGDLVQPDGELATELVL